MTWLYAETFGSDVGNYLLSFRTSDDYPHVVHYKNDGTPFHLVRSGDKSHYTSEMLMMILEHALGCFKFSLHTKCPEVTTMEYEEVAYKDVRAALLDFGKNFVVSTIVVPERNGSNDSP